MKKILKNIVIALIIVCLLATVITVVLQFSNESGLIKDETPPPSEPQEDPIPKLTNLSDYSQEEIVSTIDDIRSNLISFFQSAKYYNVSEIDSNYTKEDDETYMVLDDEFINALHSYFTDDFFEEICEDVQLLKQEDNKIYYIAPKGIFDNLFYKSAIATFDYTNINIYPVYATNEEIKSQINVQICDDNKYNLCRRDDKYEFDLVYIDDIWKIYTLESD